MDINIIVVTVIVVVATLKLRHAIPMLIVKQIIVSHFIDLYNHQLRQLLAILASVLFLNINEKKSIVSPPCQMIFVIYFLLLLLLLLLLLCVSTFLVSISTFLFFF